MIILLILWVVCAVLSYGNTMAWHNTEFGEFKVIWRYQATLWVGGPVSLLLSMIFMGVYKPQYVPLTKHQRWEIYQRNYPALAENVGFERFEK